MEYFSFFSEKISEILAQFVWKTLERYTNYKLDRNNPELSDVAIITDDSIRDLSKLPSVVIEIQDRGFSNSSVSGDKKSEQFNLQSGTGVQTSYVVGAYELMIRAATPTEATRLATFLYTMFEFMKDAIAAHGVIVEPRSVSSINLDVAGNTRAYRSLALSVYYQLEADRQAVDYITINNITIDIRI